MSNSSHRPLSGNKGSAFTLLELLISVSILAVILIFILSIFEQASRAWQMSEKRVDAFRESRAAVYVISQDLKNLHQGKTIPVSIDSSSISLSGQIAPTNIASQFFFISSFPSHMQDDPDLDRAELCAVGYYLAYSKTRQSYSLYRHFRSSSETYNNINQFITKGGISSENHLTNLFHGITIYGDGDSLLARNVIEFKLTPILDGNATASGMITNQILSIELTMKALNNETAMRLKSKEDWENWNPSSFQKKEDRFINQNVQEFVTRIRLPDWKDY